MSYFLSHLKQSGYLDKIYLTVAIIGSRVTAVNSSDQNGQAWQDFIPNLTILGFDADQDACAQINTELEEKNIDWTEIHVPAILWHQVEERNIYITQNPNCISLYRPADSYKNRFTAKVKDFEIIQTLPVETTTFDLFCEMENIEEIDVIQINVQGAELAVLQGASAALKSTLAISTHVGFIELYENQPLFADVDLHLRSHGFTLFDLVDIQRDQRKNVPIVSGSYPGTLYQSNAIYFRDLISRKLNGLPQNPEQILKLACIADAMDFPDYALEILVYLTRSFGKTNLEYNFASIIIEYLSQIPELLTLPSVEKEGLSALAIVAELQQYLL